MTTAFLVGRIIFGGYWLKGIAPLQESRLHGGVREGEGNVCAESRLCGNRRNERMIRAKALRLVSILNRFRWPGATEFARSRTFRDSSSPRAVLTERVEKPHAPPLHDLGNHSLVLFDRGDEITIHAGDEDMRFAGTLSHMSFANN